MPKVSPSSTSRPTEVTVQGQLLRIDIRPGLDAERTPLLMFGGIGASLEVFQPLVNAIDPAIEIIRVDVPGIGGSPAAALPYLMPQLALMMAQGLDQLGYPRVDVLGYSWGGALAQQFTLQCSGHCRRLVLMSTNTGFLSFPGDPRTLNYMVQPRYLSDPAQVVRLLGLLDGSRTELTAPPRSENGHSRNPTGYVHQLAALGGWTSLPFLPFIGQPVLVLSGDKDPIVPPANARLLAGLIPKSTLRIHPGGHGEIINAAVQLGAEVSAFLGSTTS